MGVDMSTCPPPGPDVHPSGDTDPEPVGPIAEQVLTDLAAGRDPLAARQHTALQRLARAHQPKEKP